MCIGDAGGRLYRLMVRIQVAVGNIVPDADRKQHTVLQHHTELVSIRVDLEIPDVPPVNEYTTSIRIVKAQQQCQDSGLASPGGSDQRYALTRRNIESGFAQDLIAAIAEGDIIEPDATLDLLCLHGTRQIPDFGSHIEYFENSLARGSSPGDPGQVFRHLTHGSKHKFEISNEQDQCPGGDGTDDHQVDAAP